MNSELAQWGQSGTAVAGSGAPAFMGYPLRLWVTPRVALLRGPPGADSREPGNDELFWGVARLWATLDSGRPEAALPASEHIT